MNNSAACLVSKLRYRTIELQMITTRKKGIKPTDAVETARRACGEVWTQLVDAYHYLYREHDLSLSRGDAMALFCSAGAREWPLQRVREVWKKLPIEADIEQFDSNPFVTPLMREVGVQQRQQVVRRFYENLQTFFENLSRWKDNGKEGVRPKPPYRRKRYSRADWVHTRISKECGTLKLGTPGGKPPICIEWPHPEPRSVQIIYEGSDPVICAQYDSEKQDLPSGLIREREPRDDKTAGIDLGEIYLATAYDGEQTVLIDGSELRGLRQLQNKEKRWFSKRIDRKKKGSNRWRKLVEAKRKRLKEINDRIDDLIHKLSTRLVEELWSRGVSTIAIGDITGIRENIDYGAEMNRRLHQWAFRQFVEKVEYKAARYGMTVEQTGEAYTSQACPSCGARYKPSGREYRCSDCGFEAHRDQVGAMNIRARFRDPDALSSGYLEGVRATPSGAENGAPRGSPSGHKTQLPLFAEDRSAAVPTRATQSVRSPNRIEYQPHMRCVLADP